MKLTLMFPKIAQHCCSRSAASARRLPRSGPLARCRRYSKLVRSPADFLERRSRPLWHVQGRVSECRNPCSSSRPQQCGVVDFGCRRCRLDHRLLHLSLPRHGLPGAVHRPVFARHALQVHPPARRAELSRVLLSAVSHVRRPRSRRRGRPARTDSCSRSCGRTARGHGGGRERWWW